MKIDYEYESYPYHLELSKINIFFGGTSSGKSAMADFFNKSFTGQNKMFMIEHQNVSKSDFEVTYISGNANLNDEIKLSSKTLLSKIIKEVLNDLDDQLLEKIKDNIKNEIASEQVRNFIRAMNNIGIYGEEIEQYMKSEANE